MNCFMLPGQPLTHDSLLPDDRDFEEISAITLKLCGLNLSDFSRPGRTDIDHVSLQIYGTAFSLYRNRLLRRQGESPSVAAEHSMGVYPAMAACGAVSEEEATPEPTTMLLLSLGLVRLAGVRRKFKQ
jgi:[acyl-carrier-protein] S-malonyltransferase